MEKIKNINEGDFITFKASDGLFRVIFCLSVQKEKSPHYFNFAITSIKLERKPTIEDIKSCNFFGKGNSSNYKFSEKDLEKMW